jgi:hypothetical protein
VLQLLLQDVLLENLLLGRQQLLLMILLDAQFHVWLIAKIMTSLVPENVIYVKLVSRV